LKVFHDGIVITEKDKILFYNDQTLKLFNISEDKMRTVANTMNEC
jgi:hypothetical protein